MRQSVINFDVLRYVLVCAEVGKIGQAANVLGIEPSTLSRKIDRLEEELGITVFERSHAGIRATSGGRNVLTRIHRVLGDIEAMKEAGQINGAGNVGEIRLGVRMPPVGEPIHSLLKDWRKANPNVGLTIHELNEQDIMAGLEDRTLDVAFMTRHTLWPKAATESLFRERLLVALPHHHRLARRKILDWQSLQEETFLVQGWNESQSAREFFASFLGSGIRFRTQPASKQTVLGMVASGYGITLVTRSQAEVKIPGVEVRPISNKDAWVGVELVWAPQSEEAVVGRFVAFLRDRARSRGLG
ncbi:MAG TPA: LysR substrate-binding domain-containing protein [Rhizomicrobium sp.]|jgi:DNA-binding transcriptional LysR family regulator